MKHGSVYQRHTRHCPRSEDGSWTAHRCRGLWAYQIDLQRDSNRRRKQITKSGFPTKAAAKTALQEQLSVLMSGVDAHGLTLSAYLDSWLTGKHALKPKTVASYRNLLDLYVIPRVGHIQLQELRAHHLDRFYAGITLGQRGRPLSASTIRRIHAVVRSALNTAVKRRLLPYNPAVHVELAPENPKRAKPWTAEQCRTFLRVHAQDRLAVLYHLLIVTGMRRGEAVGLRWEDVDLDGRCLSVVQQITEIGGRRVVGSPKTKRGVRLLPLDESTVELLRRQARDQAHECAAWELADDEPRLVFTREDGSVLRPEYVTKHFQALAKQAGLPVIRLHDLRHTNASLALAAGVDVKVVSDRLGHATTAITADLYTHVDRGVGRAAADRIASLLIADASAVPARGGNEPRPSGDSAATAPPTKAAPDRDSAGQGPAP